MAIETHRRKGLGKTMAESGVTDLQTRGQQECSKNTSSQGEGRERPPTCLWREYSEGGGRFDLDSTPGLIVTRPYHTNAARALEIQAGL